MSINKYANIIARLQQGKEEKVDKGFFTRDYLQKEWGVSRCQAGKRIKECIDAGIMEVKKFTIRHPQRGLYPTHHYKLIK